MMIGVVKADLIDRQFGDMCITFRFAGNGSKQTFPLFSRFQSHNGVNGRSEIVTTTLD